VLPAKRRVTMPTSFPSASTGSLPSPEADILFMAVGTSSFGESVVCGVKGRIVEATDVVSHCSRGTCFTSLMVMTPTGRSASTTG